MMNDSPGNSHWHWFPRTTAQDGTQVPRKIPARPTGQPWPRPPITVDSRIAPTTAASERRMNLSTHAAPQYSDVCHAYQPVDTLFVPGFSHHGNVHVRLGGCHNGNSVDPR